MNRAIVIALVILVTGCSSKPIVTYDAPASYEGDWFAIASDAPSEVELASPVVPRLITDVTRQVPEDNSSALEIEWLVDSLGNSSLLMNRQTGAAWELVETALDGLGIVIADKNRAEYRFELANNNKKGLFSFLRAKQNLNIVLIPRNNSTLVTVEGIDDVVLEKAKVEKILNDIMNYFQANS